MTQTHFQRVKLLLLISEEDHFKINQLEFVSQLKLLKTGKKKLTENRSIMATFMKELFANEYCKSVDILLHIYALFLINHLLKSAVIMCQQSKNKGPITH